MAHCHPLLMVQSILQAPEPQFASQPHAPDALVALAQVQQHANSQHQGKKPMQTLVALVLTQDNIFAGASIDIKVRHLRMHSAEKLTCCASEDTLLLAVVKMPPVFTYAWT